MRAIDHECEHPRSSKLVDIRVDPARFIGARHHFPKPKYRKFALDQLRCDAVRNPRAGAAAIDCEHEARLFRCAAPCSQRETERAVIASDMGLAAVGNMDRRIPHQGSVAEYPDI